MKLPLVLNERTDGVSRGKAKPKPKKMKCRICGAAFMALK